MLFCHGGITEWRISKETLRFLATYLAGYVDGKDNNDSPLNPTNPEVCGYHESGATPHSIVVYADGDGQGCDEATTSAHEYGHHLGFRDAYTQPPPATLHCDQSDIMSWGNMVQWYHGRILWERY